MKCNIKKDVTSKALYQSDLDCISEGLDLLEQDINQFLERKNFKEISQENALQNLEHIRSVREQLEHNRQSLSLNELKVIYIGLNFLRDDLNAPAQERSEKNRELTDRQILNKSRTSALPTRKLPRPSPAWASTSRLPCVDSNQFFFPGDCVFYQKRV